MAEWAAGTMSLPVVPASAAIAARKRGKVTDSEADADDEFDLPELTPRGDKSAAKAPKKPKRSRRIPARARPTADLEAGVFDLPDPVPRGAKSAAAVSREPRLPDHDWEVPGSEADSEHDESGSSVGSSLELDPEGSTQRKARVRRKTKSPKDAEAESKKEKQEKRKKRKKQALETRPKSAQFPPPTEQEINSCIGEKEGPVANFQEWMGAVWDRVWQSCIDSASTKLNWNDTWPGCLVAAPNGSVWHINTLNTL
ncbi:hypothetical protein MMC10_004505 [Thelotrema lepadinum]|nr:hypothetical protein [Thelotrema lepadinum]